jgi:hypothetical protein
MSRPHLEETYFLIIILRIYFYSEPPYPTLPSMNKTKCIHAAVLLALLAISGKAAEPKITAPAAPKNFIFFGHERERIVETNFLENKNIVGAQIKYTWRELEPERDHYEFDLLLKDLAFLKSHGKRLFVQLQDVSFDENVPVPAYLQKDPAFSGGADRKYEHEGDDESKEVFDGWVARRWDPAVYGRFIKLIEALGKKVDGKIEGVCLPETAIGMSETSKHRPAGFTYQAYVDGLKETMTAAHKAFPHSCVIEYANFMPGEFLPWIDNGYMKAIYSHADNIGVGVGGPDLLPHRKAQQNHCIALIQARRTGTPAGLAVQDGNLEDTDPATKKQVTVDELYLFGKDKLRLNYIFWGTQEPFYTRDILPYMRDLGKEAR